MNYKIYECESKTTASGKELKKLVLQGEGKQYPDKNVTMWSDHPLFATVAVGQTIDVELDIQDSTTPNPLGGFYKNKTVKKSGGSAAPAPDANRVERKVDALMTELQMMRGVLGEILQKVKPILEEEQPF